MPISKIKPHDTKNHKNKKNHILNLGIHKDNVQNTGFLSIIFFVILAIAYGTFILCISELPYKWLFVLAGVGCFPVLVILIGSFKRALEAILVFSFSIVMDLNVGYSDRYNDVYPGIPITFSGCILVMLYILWVLRISFRNEKVHLYPCVTIPLAVLTAWTGLSYLWAPKPNLVVFRLFGMVEMLFIFIYAANLLKSRSDILFIVKCIAYTIGLTSLVAICQYMTKSTFGLEFLGGRASIDAQVLVFQKADAFRSPGLLYSANGLAWFLKLWLPLMLAWGIAGPITEGRSLFLLSFLLGLIALSVTFSRGGWLASSVSLIFIIGWMINRKNSSEFHSTLRRIVLIGTIAILLAIPLTPKVMQRLLSDDYGAAYSRIPMAKVAINMISQNPLFGVGKGNYSFVADQYDDTPEQITTLFPYPVHNIYLMLAAELGIGALAIFLFISGNIYRQGLAALKFQNTTVKIFIISIMAGLTAFYIQGMIDMGGIGDWLSRPFWFMGGLVMACQKLRIKDTHANFYSGFKVSQLCIK